MALNPRHVPWMTILGVIGMVIGYAIGRALQQPEPIVPAFWGLCAGTVAALVLRVALTWRWTRRLKAGSQDHQESEPAGD